MSDLSKVFDVLDELLGDTDPIIPADFTDDDVRTEYPLFWCARTIAAINSRSLETLAIDCVVKAGSEIYGTPQTSSIPDVRGLRDFKAGVDAMKKRMAEHMAKQPPDFRFGLKKRNRG